MPSESVANLWIPRSTPIEDEEGCVGSSISCSVKIATNHLPASLTTVACLILPSTGRWTLHLTQPILGRCMRLLTSFVIGHLNESKWPFFLNFGRPVLPSKNDLYALSKFIKACCCTCTDDSFSQGVLSSSLQAVKIGPNSFHVSFFKPASKRTFWTARALL